MYDAIFSTTEQELVNNILNVDLNNDEIARTQ